MDIKEIMDIMNDYAQPITYEQAFRQLAAVINRPMDDTEMWASAVRGTLNGLVTVIKDYEEDDRK